MRPTHLPQRQPTGCFALLDAIASALDMPQPARSGDETYLAVRSARADLAVAAIRHALREPRDQPAMTAIADLLQVQASGVDIANLYAVADTRPATP